MKKFYALFLFCVLGGIQAFGTHMLGGEITYKYLGSDGPANKPFRYLIHFVAYIDRVNGSSWPCGNLGAISQLAIYDKGTFQKIPKSPGDPNYDLPNRGGNGNECDIDPFAFSSVRPVIIKKPISCVVPGLDPSVFSIAITDTTFEVQLPLSAAGYFVKYENNARTAATTNLVTDDNPGNTWLADIPSPVFVNSSPQFLEDAVPFFCKGDTAVIANNATDPDGDRLIYSFVQPYSGDGGGAGGNPKNIYVTPEFTSYQPGYSVSNPFGPGGYAFINPSTGLTKYYTNNQGNYAVAVEIQEYRTLSNGTEILLSSTRREFLVVVKECAPNPAPNPVPPPGFSIGGTKTITEGDSVSFDISANDVDTTTISVISDLISGLNGYTGSLAICPTVTDTGLVKTRFRWKADCGLTKGQVRSYPINVRFEDKGCPPKINNVIYTIIVNPFKAPVITGKDSICSNESNITYTVPSGTNRQWKIQGGNIVGLSTNNTVVINVTGDTAQLRMVVTSGVGCKDSTNKKIVRAPFVPIVASAPSAFVCQDSAITLSASGGYNSVVWSPTTNLSSGTVRNPEATLSDTAQYIVTSNGPGGCVAKDTLQVKWIPRVASAGPDSILCSGTQRILGANQSTGYNFYSYHWMPTLGVQSDTSFRTGVTLSNSGTSNQTFTYVQMAVHRASGCLSTDTVSYLVKPLPVVNAGPDTAVICSGSKTLLGTQESASATYQWLPLSGLTSPTHDTTSVMLNPDSVLPQFIKYHLTKTEVLISPAPGEPVCVNSDSIVLRINPLPFFQLAAKDSICSGFTRQIGTDNQAGFNYAWSPTQGLSAPTTSQTNVTLTNLTQNPGDTIYTLTVTNGSTSCLRSKQINIRVNPLPVVNAGIDTAFCSGDSIQIGENGQTGYSYLWTPGNGIAVTTNGNPFIHLTNPNTGGANQTFQYKLLKTNNQTTCKNADSLNVTVKPLPIANAAGLDSLDVCSKQDLNLGEAGLPNHLYAWTPDSALTSSTISNPVLNINNPTQQMTAVIYTVRVTNSVSTCKNADQVKVRVQPLPIVPLAYVDTAVCSKDTISIGGASTIGYSYSWSPTTQLSNATTAGTKFSAVNNTDSPVLYNLTLLTTINATTCQNSKTLTVRVNPLPDADAGPDKEVCSKDSVQIGLPSVAGRKYEWLPITGLSDPTISNPKVGLLNTGTTNQTQVYTLLVTDISSATRCDSSDQVTVTIKPLPNAFAAATDTVTTCSTVGIGLGTTPETGLVYSWNPPAGLSNSAIANPTATLTTSGSFSSTKFKITVTNPGTTCTNFDSVWVHVNPLPVVQLGVNDSLCSGDTIQLGSSLVSLNNFKWTPATGLSNNLVPSPLISLINATQTVQILPYQLLVTDLVTGCADSSTLQIRVNPLPIADAGTDRSICSGESTEVGASSNLGFGYAWATNAGLSLNTISNPVFSQSITGNPKQDTLSLTVTNSTTGCKQGDQVIVTTNPRPVPMTFGAFSNTVCPFTPNVNYTVSNSNAGNTYAWQVGGGTQISGGNTNSITVNWGDTNQAAYVVVTPTNQYSCVGTKDSLQITLNQNLRPTTPFGDTALCSYFKANRIYTTIPTPGSNYTWKLLGTTQDSILTTGGEATVSWTSNDGTGYIWIQQQSSTIDPITQTPVQCYGRSDTLKVVINPSPDSTLAVNGITSVCATTGTLEGYTLNGMTGSGYAWTIQPTTGSTLLNGQNTDSVTINWSTPGSYTVDVLETSNKGCVGRPRTKSVAVNALPSPGITSASVSALNICSNDLTKKYEAQSAPGFANSSWKWTIGGGVAKFKTDSSVLEVNWSNEGIYSLKLEETTSQGCKSETTLPLNYDPSGLVLRNVSLLENDENQVEIKFTLMSQATNTSTLALWRKEMDADATTWKKIAENIAKNISSYIDQPGSTSTKAYSYRVSGTNVCLKAIESSVQSTILLKANALQAEEIAQLSWNAYMGWPFGVESYRSVRKVDNEVSFSDLESGIHPDSVHRSLVIAPDGFNQCFRIIAKEKGGDNESISNSVCVKFENPLSFNNFISPNGDKMNDGWMIKNLPLYPNNEVTVYDRWGKKVFEKTNYSVTDLWEADGIATGTYFYKFSVPDRSLNYSGWLQIMK